MRVISAVLILISVTGSGWIRTGDVLAAVPDASQRERLLKVREDGWRAFFANDQARMKAIFPADTIAINAGQADWDGQKETLVAAEQFVSQHGKLVSLQFPRTEIQIFGDVAVLYSVYRLETEVDGKRTVQQGRATEIFHLRNGQWVNPGWHTDSGT
jgi:ketosteroid isomerase-like protein